MLKLKAKDKDRSAPPGFRCQDVNNWGQFAFGPTGGNYPEEEYLWLADMLPDYPHKVFGDKRLCYCLLMEALAQGATPPADRF
jgi:hypothetical protein